MRFWRNLTATGILVALACALAQTNPSANLSKEWPTYGHDPGGMRFSPLTEITPANVGKLKVAWVYHMRPADFTPAGRGRGPAPGAPAGDTPEGRGRGP